MEDLSLPARGAWIEIKAPLTRPITLWSLPARGAWIEILTALISDFDRQVAPRKGSVD